MRLSSTILILALTLSVISANSIHRQYRNLVEPKLNENLENSEIKLKNTELVADKSEKDEIKLEDGEQLTRITPEIAPEVADENKAAPVAVVPETPAVKVERDEKVIEQRNLEAEVAVLKQDKDVVEEKPIADVKEVLAEKEEAPLAPALAAVSGKELEVKPEPIKEEKLAEEKPTEAEVPAKKDLEPRVDDVDAKNIKVEVIELPRNVDVVEPVKKEEEISIEPAKVIDEVKEIKEDKKKSKVETALEVTDDLETKKNTIELTQPEKVLEVVVPLEKVKQQKVEEKEDRKIEDPVLDVKPETEILPETISEIKSVDLAKNEINIVAIPDEKKDTETAAKVEEEKPVEKILEPSQLPVEEKKIEIPEEAAIPEIKKISEDEVRQNSNSPTPAPTQPPNLIQQLVANNPITNFINQVQQGLRPQSANAEGATPTTEQPNLIAQGIQNFQNTIQGFQNGLQNLVNPNAANQTTNSTNAPFNIFNNIFPNNQQQQQQQPNPLQAVAQNIQNIFNPQNRLSSTTTTTTAKPVTDPIQNVNNKVDFVRNSDEVLTESNENYNEQEIYVGDDEISGQLY